MPTSRDRTGLSPDKTPDWQPDQLRLAPGDELLKVSTSSSGGVAIPLIDGRPHIADDVLYQLFPLPKVRTLLDPASANIAGATKPAGVTITTVAAPGEMGETAIRIDYPQSATDMKIVIPVLPDRLGNYSSALPQVDFRIKFSDCTSITRMYIWACEDAAATKGYFWVESDDGANNSLHGVRGAYAAAWNAWRTMSFTAYDHRTATGSPTTWNETAPEYPIQSIAITLRASAGGTIWLNRLSSEQWDRGAVVTQLDGTYADAVGPIFDEFYRRGWGGVASRLYADHATYADDATMIRISQSNWDIFQHTAALVGANPVAFSDTTTDDEIRATISGWRRLASKVGYRNGGDIITCNLQNQGRGASRDTGRIYRENGIVMARGWCADSRFGIDPFAATTKQDQWGFPYPQSFLPRWGQYNYAVVMAGLKLDGTTGDVNTRHIYASSATELQLNRAKIGKACASVYIHHVYDYNGVDMPPAGHVSKEFVARYIEHLDALWANNFSVVPISPRMLYKLTYGRPGPIYRDWTGAWVSRDTGAVVL